MTTTTNILELRTESAIRAILRGAMRNITTIEDYDHAISCIDAVGWQRMHDRIVLNYAAGYAAAGALVRQGLRTAAVSPNEDLRIAQHTTRLIYGLERVADNHRNEIQAALRTQYEKGATATQIANRMERFFDDNRVAASRFARTATNDIYNAAHLDRYEDSGVVDGVQYSAHIDNRTSDICRVLDGTIWALDDPGIQTPPNHFNCRSRIVVWLDKIPGKRDYSKQFSPEMLAQARQTQETFRSTYWRPFPRTKASATFQRRFLDNRDITDISRAMNLMKRRVRAQELKIKSLRAQMTKGLTKHELAINRSLAREMAEIHAKILSSYKVTSSSEIALLIKRLKNVTDTTTIVESYGKSLMLDNIERRLIREAIEIEIAAKIKAGKIIRADALKRILETV